ncbi:hypothetical protein GCM10011312_16570 [Planktosalinus lacus]|uniref:Uncharacterized protein n=1 Tax=Planktosalinus lacus TaxID=1526573 RepID=A0A8J2VAK5_9FLAO|nr:hypothetical protein GCM10011312_16570 [Planktosalinus lacus]
MSLGFNNFLYRSIFCDSLNFVEEYFKEEFSEIVVLIKIEKFNGKSRKKCCPKVPLKEKLLLKSRF